MPINVSDHYILAVYQFTHDIDGSERWRRVALLERHWESWWCRLKRVPGHQHRVPEQQNEALDAALDNSFFFLPYLRDLLFPETTLAGGGEPSDQRDRLLTELDKKISTIVAHFSPDAIIHLTLREEQLKPFCHLAIKQQHIICDWIDAYLFPQRVGFLVFKLKAEPGGDFDGVLDAMSAVRHVYAPSIKQCVSNWQFIGDDGVADDTKFTARDLIDYLLQGCTQGSLAITAATIREFMQLGRTAPRFTSTRDGQVYGETFRLYTAAAVQVPPELRPDPPFETIIDQTSFELTNGRRSPVGGSYEPHPHYLARLTESQRIVQWADWVALAMPDRVSFLLHRGKSMTFSNAEADYFPLYILALYQKMRLSLLAGELQRGGTSSYRNLIESQSIQRDFVLFRNHYLYHEVTHKPLGGTIYHCFQRALGVTEMYESISDEVQQILEHYEASQQRDTNRMLAFITFAGLGLVVLAMVFDYVGHIQLTSAHVAWLVAGIGLLAGLYVVIDVIIRQRERLIARQQRRIAPLRR